MRGDAHSTEIEPVGVPAGLDCDIGMSSLVGVPGAGPTQNSEFLIREIEHSASQFGGELGTESSMIRVGGLLHSP